MRRFLSIASGFLLVAIASSCSLFVDLDGLTGGGGAGPPDASSDSTGCTGALCLDASADSSALDSGAEGGSGKDAGPCASVGTGGPTMVAAGTAFCIDSTEVTVQQYADFQKAGFTGTQPAECTWNSSFDPDVGTPATGCTLSNVDPTLHGDFPISCVDWCDAWAFCNWAGKTLCGNVNGSSLAYSDSITTSAEWYTACATPAQNTYPTGATYDGGCDTNGNASALAVASDTQCVGGYPGLFDMAGNVEEWIDACDDSGTAADAGAALDVCHEGGDAFNYTQTGPARCDNNDEDHRSSRYSGVGFRCCAPFP